MANQQNKHTEFWYGLIIGTVGGILGNIFVSYLMKTFDFFNVPEWVYPTSTVITLLFIVIFVYVMWKQTK